MKASRRVIPGALALALSSLPLCARELSFEDRVKAQEAIERVYYAHQIGATKSFEEAVPRAVLEKKVRTYLEESAALERTWHTPLTTQALERELERMGRNTHLPERLREIYSALGHDRRLILECLARPALAGRLSRNFSASEQRLPGAARPKAVATRDFPPPGGVLAVAQECEPGDVWNNGSLDRLPDARFSHTAVWTGTEMIVWGGEGGEGRADTGIRYDPATDTWSPASATNAPEGRYSHAAVWTGNEMIVWGGSGFAGNPYLATGGRYDPTTDTWSAMSTTNVPSGRYGHTAVWTGTEMIIWGGYDGYGAPGSLPFPDTGGRYDPATDTWSPTATTGAPAGRIGHTAVWAGNRMIVWGGGWGDHDTGGRYDPATDTWTPTSVSGAPVGRTGHTAVWTGSRMVVWGGYSSSVFGNRHLDTGGRYDPVTDIWTPTSTTNAPEGRGWFGGTVHTAVWTGNVMVVWGGNREGGYLNSGGRYDPTTDTWVPTATIGAPSARASHTAVWTEALMIIWGGYGVDSIDAGGRYDPASDTWTPTSPTSTTDAPAGRVLHTAIWTGSRMIVWGGFGHASLDSGGRYDPTTDTWTPTSTTNAPAGRYGHTAVWTGTEMVVWGGNGITSGDLNTGGRYDPIADTWEPTSIANAPEWRDTHTAVWTGTMMIVWGGLGDPWFLNNGSLYDPATDTWSSTSTTDAPSARGGHVAVWTGAEMVVWGGYDGLGFPNTGGRYDPATDTWAPTTTTNTPPSPSFSTAVWTGSRMIVGGLSGSRYDPTTDTWSPISTVNAPGGGLHTAVWTGTEMILWGGSGVGTFIDTGGRYDPAADSWSPTSTTGAPAGRIFHTAVWTETEMIVWGGRGMGDEEYLSTGGRYTPRSSGGPPPGADAGPDQAVECAGAGWALVELHGAGTGCGSLRFTWTGPFPEGGGSVQGADAAVSLPLGQSIITLRVNDDSGQSATDTVLVTVRDTTPPVVTLVADPAFLWPPNHALVPVHVTGSVIDACDLNPGVVLVSLTSSEPDDAPGPGDGGTTGDIGAADLGSPDMSLDLRAERDGHGPGRVYRLSYEVADASGNKTPAFTVVTVPHDLGSGRGPYSKPPH